MLENGELTEFFGDQTIGLDMTLAEIGYIFNLTRERIRQIEVAGLKKLKHPKIGRKLKEYKYKD